VRPRRGPAAAAEMRDGAIAYVRRNADTGDEALRMLEQNGAVGFAGRFQECRTVERSAGLKRFVR